MRPAFFLRCAKGLQLTGFLILFWISVIQAQQLKLVSIIYRHGDRSPGYTYPTDPWKDKFPEGWNQLTNIGKQQEYELGQYYRQRYASFLNLTAYIPPQVHVKSSDVDRTLMSASCNLAGMFPPEGDRVWNPALKWQPLPIHGVPLAEDYLFNGYEVCPKFAQLLKEAKLSDEAKLFDEQNKDLYELVTEKTGINVTNLFKACDIYDLFVVHRAHDLAWPDWLDNATMARLEQCLIKNHLLSTKTKEQRRLNGGVVVGDIIKNMQDKIDGKIPTKKMFMYSSHDWNIIYFLTTLGLYNDKRAPYSSSIFVELTEDKEQHFIKILYRNDTKIDPYELSLPSCSSPCPLDKFKTLTADVIPEDIKLECRTDLNASLEFPVTVNWETVLMIVLTSAFAIFAIVLLVATFCNHRRDRSQSLMKDSARKNYGSTTDEQV